MPASRWGIRREGGGGGRPTPRSGSRSPRGARWRMHYTLRFQRPVIPLSRIAEHAWLVSRERCLLLVLADRLEQRFVLRATPSSRGHELAVDRDQRQPVEVGNRIELDKRIAVDELGAI